MTRERFPDWYPWLLCGLRSGLRAGELLAGAHAVLGLEVDEHVGPRQSGRDFVLQLVRGSMSVLERRAGAELHVQVDVAARARRLHDPHREC